MARRQGEHRRRQVILAEPAEQPPLLMADLLHARAILGARGALVAAESGRRAEFAIVCIGQTLFFLCDRHVLCKRLFDVVRVDSFLT